MKKSLLLTLAIIPCFGAAQFISTNPSNNGTGGIFTALTALAGGISITEFDTVFGSAAGSAVQVEVWTRPGTYTGFTTSNVGWTLHETTSATSAGSATWTPINLTTDIAIGAGQTVSVYLHSITVGGGIRYTGTGTGGHQTTFADA